MPTRKLSGHTVPVLLALLAVIAGLLPIGPLARLAAPAAAAPIAFTNAVFGDAESQGNNIAAGDMDRDGDIDLVLGRSSTQAFSPQDLIYVNDGRGGFYNGPDDCGRADMRCFSGPFSSSSDIAVGDLNGDGYLDIVEVSMIEAGPYAGGQQNHIYINTQNNTTFVRKSFGYGVDRSYSTALGDIDGDGDLDIAVVNTGLTHQSGVYLNDGEGGFKTGAPDLPVLCCAPLNQSISYRGAAFGDIDGDGKADLVLGGYGSQSRIFRLRNGALVPLAVGPDGVSAEGVSVADLNSDGNLDIVLPLSNQNKLLVYFVTPVPGGDPTFQESLLDNASSENVALGDIEGDGDLDIVSHTGRMYLNDGAGAFTLATLFSEVVEVAEVALADLNGDGHLDIVGANSDRQGMVMINTGAGGFRAGPTFAYASQVELGDVNGDGKLDIVGNNGTLAINGGGGQFALDPPYASAGHTKIALGDLNGDGKLDIVGIGGAGAKVYLRGQNGYGAGADFDTAYPFQDVALGDMDRDGDLDIVALFNGLGWQHDAHILIYRNDGAGGFTQRSANNVPEGAHTGGAEALGLGDFDGDGNLDIVASWSELDFNTLTQGTTISFNAGEGADGLLQFGDGVTLPQQGTTIGDIDADADLDLLIGYGVRKIYLNDGARNFNPGPLLYNQQFGNMALGDVDGDGDLDIAGADLESGVLINDGKVNFNGRRSLPRKGADDVRLGDLDGDGDLDMVALFEGAATDGVQVFFNDVDRRQGPADRLPTLTIRRPVTAEAGGYSTPVVLTSPVISLTYRLADPEGDPVAFIKAYYSPDGGGRWIEAAPTAATQTKDLEAPPAGQDHIFGWDTFASNFFGQSDNLTFRIVAYPTLKTRASAPAGPFQRASVSATTSPFRVQGTQVRVLDGSRPGSPSAAGAIIYRLPAGELSGAQPFRDGAATRRTDALGYLPGRGAIAKNDQLIAVLPVSQTLKFSRYLTSAAVGDDGLVAASVINPGVQELTISDANPLLAINLTVSLEWDARNDAAYLAQLKTGLRRASELLYIWSDGQIALGDITIYQNKERWAEADVQIYATNSLRPNANQGGIVEQDDTVKGGIKYDKGQIRMGAVWTRFGDAGGEGGEDWPRAFAHEVGHWALFLDEDYLGFDANKQLISVQGCASPMADPYRPDYGQFRASTPKECQPTLNQQVSGRSNWETIKLMYDTGGWELNVPASYAPDSGPVLLPFAITAITEAPVAGPSDTLPLPIFSLQRADGTRYLAGGGAQAVLFRKGAAGDLNATATRLTNLGLPERGEVIARGARVGDRLCVFDLDEDTLGCETIAAGDTLLTMQKKTGWSPELLIRPTNPLTYELRVENLSDANLTVKARLYTGESNLHSEVITLTRSGSDYVGTVTLEDPILSGMAHVWVDECKTAQEQQSDCQRREAVTEYALGGNPAPPKKPKKRKGRNAPALSPDGQVVLFSDNLDFSKPGSYFAIQSLTALPLDLPPWTRPVGQGYRLIASANAPDIKGTALNIGYLEADVVPGTEGGLAMYYLPLSGTAWQRLVSRQDAQQNEISAEAQGPGFYVLVSTLGLREGWNILSYPWPRASVTISEGIRLLRGEDAFTTLYGYDPGDSSDPWKVYDVGIKPVGLNDLKELRYGRGYWVNVATASPTGLEPGTTLDTALPPRPATLYGVVAPRAGYTPAAGQTVRAIVGGQVCATTTTRSVDGQVAFMLDVPAAAERAGCGTPGATVAIEVAGRPYAQVAWDDGRPWAVEPGATPGRSTILYLPAL